jgi:hypothetical protein
MRSLARSSHPQWRASRSAAVVLPAPLLPKASTARPARTTALACSRVQPLRSNTARTISRAMRAAAVLTGCSFAPAIRSRSEATSVR